MKKMKFIKPRNKQALRVYWKFYGRTHYIVKYYAEYTEHTEEEVVDEFLTNILLDENFLEWIKNKRYNKRIMNRIFNSGETSIG
ncbi:hypothetical protein [Thermaerobacillus caldiproteolyticus]|uniref:hypothetical protein n=1 Tax=Thermaerobacillus caldiproteolyticus TaxID=247480 RepID=UPI001E4B0936|nr:hypothetical protein [Anoxybacillus caldiproteolyticus]